MRVVRANTYTRNSHSRFPHRRFTSHSRWIQGSAQFGDRLWHLISSHRGCWYWVSANVCRQYEIRGPFTTACPGARTRTSGYRLIFRSLRLLSTVHYTSLVACSVQGAGRASSGSILALRFDGFLDTIQYDFPPTTSKLKKSFGLSIPGHEPTEELSRHLNQEQGTQ